MGVERQLKAPSADTLQHRHAEAGHPVRRRAGDLGFGPLGRAFVANLEVACSLPDASLPIILAQ